MATANPHPAATTDDTARRMGYAALPVIPSDDPRLSSERPIGYRCRVPCVMLLCTSLATCEVGDNPAMARCATCATADPRTSWNG